MYRSIPTALLAGIMLVAFAALPTMLPASTMSLSGSAMAQKPAPETKGTVLNNSKSNSFKITGVNATAKTFTAISKGKEFTFAAPKGKPLPTVGKIYDITYTESPSGPLNATTINNSKNSNY